ncbi:MAG: hypothetical protein QXF25_02120 [Candidatus Pacearchaeota archaeon]
MEKKKGLEMSFSWIFAIMAGAVILFLAIYSASKFIKTSKYEATTVTAKELSIIFEPLETGIASFKGTKAVLNEETRIFNSCYDSGIFGEQRFSLATKKGKQWSKPGGEIIINNKYVFSNSSIEGKKIFIFGVPFNFPFKVADMIILTTKSYCFVNAPGNIVEDLENLGLENIKLEEENCTKEDIRVCFSGGFGSSGKCDMTVYGTCNFDCESDFDEGYVTKKNKNLYFYKNLIYAAIFSDYEVYECNVKRLMKKALQLALLYQDEANLVSAKCETIPSGELASFSQQLSNLKSSQDIIALSNFVKRLENQAVVCELW